MAIGGVATTLNLNSDRVLSDMILNAAGSDGHLGQENEVGEAAMAD